MHQQSLSAASHAWFLRQLPGDDWLPAAVPGGVHTDLLALGKIPDPFVADHEKQVQWIGECDWEYRRSFDAGPELSDEERQWLVCDGLDTLATVFLNGSELGQANNQYRRWQWPVDGLLRPSGNELRIVFAAPVSFIRARQMELPLIGGGDIAGGPHLRKAPCQWGWDWGPKLPPIGIWKDIRLEGYSRARLEDLHIRQQHHHGQVTLSAAGRAAYLSDADNLPLRLSLTVTAPDGQQSQAQAPLAADGSVRVAIEIEQPQLWQPNGYGQQPLYQVEVGLEAEKGVRVDSRRYSVGLRTIELRQQPDDWGESFSFVVNGTPVFAKGADWIPADSFPTRISDAALEHLIYSSAAAHMNMLRVWGGGFYEEERFYDLCDRYGILVWQDFTFACGIYPADEAFAENVRQEAIENVRRLRHRASLALWCGNNEMEQGWSDWGWNRNFDPQNQRLKAGYDRMFHHLLPEVVAAEDPDRRYWPSSASSGIPFAEPNGAQRGDMHYWEVWHGRKPFSAYRSQYPRFMSEFGFQALPTYPTVQSYAAPQDQNMTSYVMEHHQRSGSGNGLMIGQMTDTFRMPSSFRSLVYLSMILQAEGIRYGVEHWRRNMKRVSGTLYWQLNDCWPVASWASIDYFGRWKALHYAARRFYAPLLLSVKDEGTKMEVHLSSDLSAAWQGELRWRLEDLGGRVLDEGRQPVQAAPLADGLLHDFSFAAQINDENRRRTLFVCELWQGELILSQAVCSFAPNKHLELTAPQISVRLSENAGQAQIQLQAAAFARFVELSVEGQDIIFSDNYFDLSPNQPRTIQAPLPTGWTLEQLKDALQVRSLFDSYQPA